MAKQTVVVIVGPTASGKSDVAVALARRFNGEVISADSRQVYRGLDIGTGKITKREMCGVPHHLLDVVSPRRTFTASDFVQHAARAVSDIISRGKLPIIAGGTGFYIDALVGNQTIPHVPPNATLRAQLAGKNPAELLALLEKDDPDRVHTVEQKNPRRLVRAIEIARALGAVPRRNRASGPYNVCWIGLKPETATLRERIRARLLKRLKSGMVNEARTLHERGVSWRRMEELGLEYRYLSRYLRGQINRDEFLEQLNAKIWQYAKRQMTYWKRNGNIVWFEPKDAECIERYIGDCIGKE